MTDYTPPPGWFDRQLDRAAEQYRRLPRWMREALLRERREREQQQARTTGRENSDG